MWSRRDNRQDHSTCREYIEVAEAVLRTDHMDTIFVPRVAYVAIFALATKSSGVA